MTSPFHIGMSGWTHAPWRGHFYPEGLRIADELTYAANQLGSIEVNGTFYRLQTPKTFAHWYDQTPDGFRFSIKASRYMTHSRHIENILGGMPNFFASGLFALREKLGPILWQFPPGLVFDHSAMEKFLSALPHTGEDAARLVKAATLPSDRTLVDTNFSGPIIHAVETRNPSFLCPAFIELLNRYNVSAVVTDSQRWDALPELTGPIAYVRLEGGGALGTDSYPDEVIREWANRVSGWAYGPPRRDVYVYFDVGVKLNAPLNALRMQSMLEPQLAGSD